MSLLFCLSLFREMEARPTNLPPRKQTDRAYCVSIPWFPRMRALGSNSRNFSALVLARTPTNPPRSLPSAWLTEWQVYVKLPKKGFQSQSAARSKHKANQFDRKQSEQINISRWLHCVHVPRVCQVITNHLEVLSAFESRWSWSAVLYWKWENIAWLAWQSFARKKEKTHYAYQEHLNQQTEKKNKKNLIARIIASMFSSPRRGGILDKWSFSLLPWLKKQLPIAVASGTKEEKHRGNGKQILGNRIFPEKDQ